MKYVIKNMNKLLEIPLQKASACYTYVFDGIIDMALHSLPLSTVSWKFHCSFATSMQGLVPPEVVGF